MASSSHMAGSVCPACGRSLASGLEPTRISTCGHTFHMDCLCEALYAHVTSNLTPAGCPKCDAEVVRPPKPDVKHLMASEIREKGRICTEADAWHRVHNKLRQQRDHECNRFAHGLGMPVPSRSELAVIRQKTNFFEMVNACWVCRKALIQDVWVTLPECKHAVHMRCVMHKWWNPQWYAYWHGIGYPCPLCEEANVCPKSDDVNWDWSFIRMAGDHLRELPIDGLWYAMMYAIRRQSKGKRYPDTYYASPLGKREYREVMDELSRDKNYVPKRDVRPRVNNQDSISLPRYYDDEGRHEAAKDQVPDVDMYED